MQEEIGQFERLKVWQLVPSPTGQKLIGVKWISKNKKYSNGVVLRNKEKLVAKGYRQQEGIDYDETVPEANLRLVNRTIKFVEATQPTAFNPQGEPSRFEFELRCVNGLRRITKADFRRIF
ncbi:uncharacterized mitochondrial protein AtMg00820-like [Rutidosis leptorrhynchoides]|uniref:uncharacterized mitochondrial protein AtMg00820-like n=1 Tax=Rutidosis leptorrhynchoides TaxID=125765 RepID=UPI003A99FC3D